PRLEESLLLLELADAVCDALERQGLRVVDDLVDGIESARDPGGRLRECAGGRRQLGSPLVRQLRQGSGRSEGRLRGTLRPPALRELDVAEAGVLVEDRLDARADRSELDDRRLRVA